MLKIILVIIVAAVLRSEGNYIMKYGKPLSPQMQTIAREIGIKNPEDIRTLEKGKVFGQSNLGGITIGNAIEYKRGCEFVLVHELIHVKQYQDNGGVKGFLKIYISEILKYGYDESPLEKEAEKKSLELMKKYNIGG
jgi:hypothetical protein